MSTDIDSADICERLVGITPTYLQNFIAPHRELFGLTASVQSGKVRKKRRRFSRDDVFGIALVWLLFESGLRTDPIERVLKDVAGTKKGNANIAAKTLLESQADHLLIIRKPRIPTKTPHDRPEQIVKAVRQSDLGSISERHALADILVVPVGAKFRDVSKRLELLFGA